MSLDEYVEKLVYDAFKREWDGEENVVRSIPFFAAAFAILISMLGFVRDAIPALAWTFYSIFSWIVLFSIGCFSIFSFVSLYQAVRPRDFDYPMSEGDLVRYAMELKEFYRAKSLAGAQNLPTEKEVSLAAVGDLRELMIKQFARCAEKNRRNNKRRSVVRTRAYIALVWGIGLAFVLVSSIIVKNSLGIL